MADQDVHRYLKLFTFEPLEDLEKLMKEHNKDASKRVAQHKLAKEVLSIVHGKKIAVETEQEHRSLFKKPSISVPQLSAEGKGERPLNVNRILNKTAPVVDADSPPFHSLTLPKSLVYNQPVARVLYHAGMVALRSEGHRMVEKKGAYVGARPGGTGTMSDQVDWSPATNWEAQETEKNIIGGDTLFMRVGKWKVKIIKIIGDKEFEERGLTAPGWEALRQGKELQSSTNDSQKELNPEEDPDSVQRASLAQFL